MKRIAILTVLLSTVCMTIMAQSVTGQTSGLNSTLLKNLQTFARNVNRSISVTSGRREQNDQQRLYNDGLARGGHISSDHQAAVRNGSDCTITTTGGGALHAPRRDGKGWMEISRPRNADDAGGSKHLTGDAADVSGISFSDCAELNKAGLRHTVPSEEWHVEVGTSCVQHRR